MVVQGTCVGYVVGCALIQCRSINPALGGVVSWAWLICLNSFLHFTPKQHPQVPQMEDEKLSSPRPTSYSLSTFPLCALQGLAWSADPFSRWLCEGVSQVSRVWTLCSVSGCLPLGVVIHTAVLICGVGACSSLCYSFSFLLQRVSCFFMIYSLLGVLSEWCVMLII